MCVHARVRAGECNIFLSQNRIMWNVLLCNLFFSITSVLFSHVSILLNVPSLVLSLTYLKIKTEILFPLSLI